MANIKTGDLDVVEEIDGLTSEKTSYNLTPKGYSEVREQRARRLNRSYVEYGLQLWQYLLAVFLPAGYPQSVTKDYLNYQIYDSLQAFCSSIAGLLSSRAVLSSVGVGDSNASPTSALLLSVLQESTGRVATILFAHRLGTSLEPECKAYRLAADVFNDAAMILDCLSPAFPRHIRVLLLSGSSILRSLCGVAAGSAKASLSAHFATKGNLGEVNAKDSSQETVISLLGMLFGTFVISHVTSTRATWTAMIILLGLHLGMNYLAVRSVHMNTLNRQRANIVFSHLFRTAPEEPLGPALRPDQVAEHERIFAMDGTLERIDIVPNAPAKRQAVGYVKIGAPFGELITRLRSAALRRQPLPLKTLLSIFEDEGFILMGPPISKSTLVILKDGASPETVLKAWALAFQEQCRGVSPQYLHGGEANKTNQLRQGLEILNSRWNAYKDRLKEAGWDLTIGSIETGKARRIRLRKKE